MTAKEFYEANATNICNVPRPSHPEDPSGWDGVRRASEAQFIAKTVPVMPLWDVCDFAEKYHSAGVRELTEALEQTLVIARQALVYFNTESGRAAMKELKKIEARIKGEK